MVVASFMIVQHISSLFIFLSTFTRLLDGTLDPRLLIVASVVCFIVGYIIWELVAAQTNSVRAEMSKLLNFYSPISS